jgi:hypothetical protein
MTGQENGFLFNTSDFLIEVTAWVGLTVYRNEGRDGSTWSMTIDCHWKSMESWVGMTYLVFCNGYDAPTHFWNLQTRSLACREHGTLQACYPLWSIIRFSVLQRTVLKMKMPLYNVLTKSFMIFFYYNTDVVFPTGKKLFWRWKFLCTD